MPVDEKDYEFVSLTVSNYRLEKTFKCKDKDGQPMSFSGYSGTFKAYELDGSSEIFSASSDNSGEFTFSGDEFKITKVLDPAVVKPRTYRYVIELQGPLDSVSYERVKGKINIEQNL